MHHLLAFAGFSGALLLAAASILTLSSQHAGEAQAGESLVAVFPPAHRAAQVLDRLADAPVRQLEPLGLGNAWLVQASDEGLAQALKARGALLVVRASGPIHFALGCAPPATN